jgi:2-amino-4-hydroxy-6-hydroxymethyldihydropteridine diphosphokinase
MTTAYIALGSNLPGVCTVTGTLRAPNAQLDAACIALDALAFSRLRRVSSYYASPAWSNEDTEEKQPDYVNAVAEIQTDLAPDALLSALHDIENTHQRVRDPARRYGPRTLDLDLLVYGRIRLKTVNLTLPHPRLHERAFVLVPLLEIAPDLDLPGLGKAAGFFAAVNTANILKLEKSEWPISTQT